MGWSEPINEQETYNDWASSVPPEMLESLRSPRKVWGGPVTPAEGQENDISRIARYLQEGSQPQQGLEDTSDDLLNFVDPMMLKSIAKWGLKGLAEGAAPLAAGMVRMGGKSFPNAYLHRALGDPAELDWLASLFQKGRSTQKPTSAVTPSVMSTFGSEPYGLLFNADANAGQIAHAGARDLYSSVTRNYADRDRARQLVQAMQRTNREAAAKSKGKGLKWMEDPEWEKYQDIYDALDSRLGTIPKTEKWTPTMETINEHGINTSLVDPEKRGLDSLFNKQRGWANKLFQEHGDTGGTDAFLLHNEIIPNIDRSMLAGVRLPMSELDMLEMGPTISSPMQRTGTSDIYKALTQFAEQQHVPIFRWPAEMTQAQQLKGLEAPLKGTWKTPPGKNYITSDMLEKIFGITELP
jgi:hypothetical protein